MHYVSHLSKDKKLKKVLAKQDPHSLKKRKNLCLYLCASIMSQQLSIKVADVIYKRFIELYSGNEPTPQQIIDTPFEKLRGIGLSNAKVNYVKNVAEFELKKGMDAKKIAKMSNEEIMDYLIEIKGVGKWTIEMLLMFALGREDVFSADDFGIQSAMIKLYELDNSNKKKFREKMIELSAPWSPYRTYACLHLWKWKDEPAEKKSTGTAKKKLRPKEKIR